MLPAPELKALNPARITMRMINQPSRILFETVGKFAGINVVSWGAFSRSLKFGLLAARLSAADASW